MNLLLIMVWGELEGRTKFYNVFNTEEPEKFTHEGLDITDRREERWKEWKSLKVSDQNQGT